MDHISAMSYSSEKDGASGSSEDCTTKLNFFGSGQACDQSVPTYIATLDDDFKEQRTASEHGIFKINANPIKRN
jgi:hypothetical protein